MTIAESLKFNRSQPADLLVLKFMMLQRGIKTHQLADMAGVNRRVMRNVIAGTNTAWPPRAAINSALKSKVFQKPPTAYRPFTRASEESANMKIPVHKLSRRYFNSLPVYHFLVSCVGEPHKPNFAEHVAAEPAAREAQWRRIRAGRADNRNCFLFINQQQHLNFLQKFAPTNS